MMGRLASLGFNPVRLGFATRVALASCVALVLAWVIGLEHPQWAAMTVWAASQPTRGQLLEKGAFRFLGSVVGTIAGVALVMSMQVHPALMVAGLTLWVSGCTYLGNLQRGFVAYGTVLAGYTAAMVALLDTGHPENVLTLGADRLGTVLLGVAVAMLGGWFFTPRAQDSHLREKVLSVLGELLALAARAVPAPEERGRLLSELAAIEESLDPHGAGSLRSREVIRRTRAVLIAATPLLLWKHGDRQPEGFQDRLSGAASALAARDIPATLAALTEAARIGGLSLRFVDTLTLLAAALAAWERQDELPRQGVPRMVLHRDWVGAREAGLRALLALACFGTLWLLTGWKAGPFMLLGLSIMISLFSTFENPARIMGFVFRGQILGISAALALRWLVWPQAGSELDLILMTLPFILLGAPIYGHTRTELVSMDYVMVMLLMSQPHWPLTGDFATSLFSGLAVVTAPVAAMIAYRTIYPANLRRRIESLKTTMLNDLRDIASDPNALEQSLHWQARLYHRILRLVRLSKVSAQATQEAQAIGLAVLNLGHTSLWCHRMIADPKQSASTRRYARVVLARLAQDSFKLVRTRRALARRQIDPATPEAVLFADALAGVDTLGGEAGSLAKGQVAA